MKILIAGSSGMIGSALRRFFSAAGHEVVRLVRRPVEPGESAHTWDPANGELVADAIEGFDAFVNVAGENIGEGLWTAEKKARIRSSRLDTTRLLAETAASLDSPPGVLINASAVGYYGNRGDEVLTEESAPGEGFLAELTQQWEAATSPAVDAGIRVVNTRFGVVVDPKDAGMRKMLPVFRLGLGGVLGDGNQWFSWVTLTDLVGAVYHAVQEASLSGPVNVVAPEAVTNRGYTKALAAALHRPALFTVPAFALRMTFGEMARETLLSSVRAKPAKLVESGYEFQLPRMSEALRHVL